MKVVSEDFESYKEEQIDSYQPEGGDKDEMNVERIKELVKENLNSGITVALVSIPLSCALAMASGGTAMMGLSTAIYGPAIGGVLGGSHYNILGPAGALVNILSTLVNHNGPEIIPLVAFWGGILSFCVYLSKLENYCCWIPISVLEGFSLGVACAIGFGQWKFAFGLQGLTVHKKFYENVWESVSNTGNY
jgi:SulP family sulfate permease